MIASKTPCSAGRHLPAFGGHQILAPAHVRAVQHAHVALLEVVEDREVLLAAERAPVGLADVEDVVVAGDHPRRAARGVDRLDRPVRADDDLDRAVGAVLLRDRLLQLGHLLRVVPELRVALPPARGVAARDVARRLRLEEAHFALLTARAEPLVGAADRLGLEVLHLRDRALLEQRRRLGGRRPHVDDHAVLLGDVLDLALVGLRHAVRAAQLGRRHRPLLDRDRGDLGRGLVQHRRVHLDRVQPVVGGEALAERGVDVEVGEVVRARGRRRPGGGHGRERDRDRRGRRRRRRDLDRLRGRLLGLAGRDLLADLLARLLHPLLATRRPSSPAPRRPSAPCRRRGRTPSRSARRRSWRPAPPSPSAAASGG